MSAVKTASANGPREFEYLRLVSAAKLVGCTMEDLLHLGAVGKATLLAPVIAAGEYEWRVSSAGEESWHVFSSDLRCK
jgi:hypothetical protein